LRVDVQRLFRRALRLPRRLHRPEAAAAPRTRRGHESGNLRAQRDGRAAHRRLHAGPGILRRARHRLPLRLAGRAVQAARPEPARRGDVPVVRGRSWPGRGAVPVSRSHGTACPTREAARAAQVDRGGSRSGVEPGGGAGRRADARSLARVPRRDRGGRLVRARRPGTVPAHGAAPRCTRLPRRRGAAAFRTGLYRLLLRRKAAIVVFHRVGTRSEDGLPGCTTQEFRAYCDFFAEYFRVISLGELLDRLGRGEDVSRCLVITFDDGYRDNYDVAAIELAHRGLPACFFVVTGLVGSRTAPPWSTAGRTELEWLSWEQLGLLAARGFEIGSHTVHHIDLGRLTAADALREITDSKRRLEQALRTPVRYFSYPYGGRDQMPDAYRTLLRPVGFACCLSAYGGVVTPGTDPLHLPRIPGSPWYLTPGQVGFELLELALAAPPGSRRRVPIPKSLAPA